MPVDGEIVVEGSALRFIDRHGLLALEAHARRTGATVVLRGHRGGAARLAEMPALERVRVEALA